MEWMVFCRGIGLAQEATAQCASLALTQAEAESEYDALCSDEATFFARMDAFADAPARYLALYVQFALLARAEYERRGISQAIFFDTMQDIALWEREFFGTHGAHGLEETEWLAKHVRLKLFRLGSLQFEPIETLPCALPQAAEGLPTFYVHIPKGADISRAATADAFRAALQFWGLEHAAFLCHSWLVNPVLRKLLPDSARIVQFGALFETLDMDDADRQAEERIFGALQDDPAQYAAGSSLQTAARAHLLAGGKLSGALGMYVAAR